MMLRWGSCTGALQPHPESTVLADEGVRDVSCVDATQKEYHAGVTAVTSVPALEVV